LTDQQDDIRITDLHMPKPLVPRSGIESDVPPPTGVLPTREKSNLISSVLSGRESLPELARPISRGFTPARFEHKVEPIYPAQARQAGIAREVKLRTTVGADGKVRDVQIITGNPLLVRAAVEWCANGATKRLS
jgi:outer membrane biosynthesis protein TonB